MLRTLVLTSLITLGSSVAAAQTTYIPNNNLLVIEMEDSGAPSSWEESTSTNGFVGESYIVWEGPNFFNQPGEGVFGFNFEAPEAGQWILRIRNRHEDSDPTEENDVWARMDGGPWVKTFSNGPGSVGAWTFESTFELGHGNFQQAQYNLSVGTHRIEFSGRSNGFKMDRFHLHRPSASGQMDASQPPSVQRFGNTYGNANPNSTGQISVVEAVGYPEASANNLVLGASGLPASVPGFFIASRNQAFIANPAGSSGNLLLGGTIGRFNQNLDMSTAAGTASLRIDLSDIPTPTGSTSATAGQFWNFQFWHRDSVSGNPTSNFSRGLQVLFQ